MKRFLTLTLWLGPLLVGIVGCAAVDPTHRAGTWQPVGANDANLRVMVANPEDLYHGEANTRADGAVAARAVARYRAGKAKELPDSAIAQIAPISINNNTSSSPAGSN
ncbi:hypothetical protein [Lichenicoccus sp.]|uniref:hypothetical protein n=1 Tax=Lichenicoccus sp. TaxID=2781899 RepID=UPI003D144937